MAQPEERPDTPAALDVDADVSEGIRFLRELGAETQRREVELSNGIKLRIKAVPPHAVRRAVQRIAMPKVPVVYIEDKDREEENPNDPDYLEAVERTHERRLEATWRLFLAMGTDVLEVPDGLHGPDADGWIEEVEAAKDEDGRPYVEVGDFATDRERYLAWLLYYAIAGPADQGKVSAVQFGAVGVMESEVAEAVAYFRGKAERRTDRAPDPPRSDTDGDNVRKPPRRRAGTRRARGS